MISDLIKLHVCRKRTWFWFSTWGGPPRLTPNERDANMMKRLYTGAKRYGYRGAQSSMSFINGLNVEDLRVDIEHVT